MTARCLHSLLLGSFFCNYSWADFEFCELSLLNLAQKFLSKNVFYAGRMDYSPEKKYYQRKTAIAQYIC